MIEKDDGPKRDSCRKSKPEWLRVKLTSGKHYFRLKQMIRETSLHTVCEEAHCPNMAECWSRGTATFMILGNTCTRNCTFCAVKGGVPEPEDPGEPRRIAGAVDSMKLSHAVITSVTRDDLRDGGASMFAETIAQIRTRVFGCTVEVLIPDFKGDIHALKKVIESQPEILGHNLETVPRLYQEIRTGAHYNRSLEILQTTKQESPNILIKSGIMVGLGEKPEELRAAMTHLREAGCDLITIGQYLQPTRRHRRVFRYYTPEEFERLKRSAQDAGFLGIKSGPLVRSSYHAEEILRDLQHI
ncbi:MAG: lipoyl synthase [Desulfobacterales bacterium]